MITFKDGEGLVHRARYGSSKDKQGRVHNAWRSVCGQFDEIHRGDLYRLHRRPLTCLPCASHDDPG